MKKLTIIAMVCFALTSCTQKIDVTTLTKNTWLLEAWKGNTYDYKSAPTLFFDKENKFSGKSFCNSYGGVMTINNGEIKFDHIFSTKLYCADQSTLESEFLKELSEANSAKVVKGKLMLYKDSQLLMTFSAPL